MQRCISAPQLCGLTALDLQSNKLLVAHLTALRQLTGLTCLNLLFPAAASDASLPELRHVRCHGFDAEGSVAWAVALTLPGLESLDVNAAADLWSLDTHGLWPADMYL